MAGDTNLAARLARLDTCVLSDALDVLGMEGVVSGLVPLWVADGSGVVVVQRSRACDVATEAERLSAREHEMAARLRSGEPVTAVLGHGYETMTGERRQDTAPAVQADGRP